ncbi:hypothetical protein BZA05DRAFT_472938 [Tricharina praecox]|uniref:uncharacterized protein n=1 Tax=Tricharina praecox TaxID=43433 RepID=UPI00221F9F1A|nr:uncharacterized protein BZA05DRAFT_472938 [Tricharina praecox]KAI5854318.1 hypothetical protein BZA05DRAFT_472938 [Tricharina praecox]
MTTPTHAIAIARASLAASLLRADPAALTRDEISHFHSLLSTALSVCSPGNIQVCKRWIVKNVASEGRRAGLAKFLAALATALADSTTTTTVTATGAEEVAGVAGKSRRESARRKRLHLLYLVNDLLHHTKFLAPDGGALKTALEGVLKGMFVAATYPKAAKQLARLERLLDIWARKGYYSPAVLVEWRTAVRDVAAEKGGEGSAATPAAAAEPQSKQKMLLLPPFHGDPSLPFYDLPAGNLLPLITPNSTAPINARLVKPVQFASITPEPKLVTAVQDFLSSMDAMFAGKESGDEPDAIGGFGGIDGGGYYGWSRAFCEQMRHKKKSAAEKDRGRGPLKKEDDRGRRTSFSSDYSSRSRSRRRSRSVSSDGRTRARRDRDRSRSRSPQREREHEPTAPQYHRGFAQTSMQSVQSSILQPPPQQQQQQAPPPPHPQQQWLPQQQQQQLYTFQQSQQTAHAAFAQAPPPPPPPPQGWIPPPFQVPPHMQQTFQHFLAQMGGGMQQMGGIQNIQQAMQQMATFQQQQQQQQWPQQQQGYSQQQMQQQIQQMGQQQMGQLQQQGLQRYGDGGYGMQGPPHPPPQLQQQQLQQQQIQQERPSSSGGAGAGAAAGNSEGYEDYRSIKGRQIGTKRGWKT